MELDVGLWLNMLLLMMTFSLVGGTAYYFIRKANNNGTK